MFTCVFLSQVRLRTFCALTYDLRQTEISQHLPQNFQKNPCVFLVFFCALCGEKIPFACEPCIHSFHQEKPAINNASPAQCTSIFDIPCSSVPHSLCAYAKPYVFYVVNLSRPLLRTIPLQAQHQTMSRAHQLQKNKQVTKTVFISS
jgi:hypothetical protein